MARPVKQTSKVRSQAELDYIFDVRTKADKEKKATCGRMDGTRISRFNADDSAPCKISIGEGEFGKGKKAYISSEIELSTLVHATAVIMLCKKLQGFSSQELKAVLNRFFYNNIAQFQAQLTIDPEWKSQVRNKEMELRAQGREWNRKTLDEEMKSFFHALAKDRRAKEKEATRRRAPAAAVSHPPDEPAEAVARLAEGEASAAAAHHPDESAAAVAHHAEEEASAVARHPDESARRRRRRRRVVLPKNGWYVLANNRRRIMPKKRPRRVIPTNRQ